MAPNSTTMTTTVHPESTPEAQAQDQYADGKAAKVWEIFIGDQNSRTDNYRNFLVQLLREKGCKRVLDVACGTGVDSIMLLEEGFQVYSIDASDKMLKYALRQRWNRRHEPAFNNWIIEEANWLTLHSDIAEHIADGFDAVICLGNSFAHLMDSYGDQRNQKLAIKNFEQCLKPGGILLIDHRNYDDILNTGQTPAKSLYYNTNHKADIKTSVVFYCGEPTLVTLDYIVQGFDLSSEFRLCYYPHKLEKFTQMLSLVFGQQARHQLFGDFKPLSEASDPAFYIHLIEKSKQQS